MRSVQVSNFSDAVSGVETMKTILTRLAAGAAAALFTISGIAAEHNAKEVKI